MMIFKGLNRLEAFSDGVFAIAITLLILEIKAPQVGEHGSSASLWTGLLHLWPSYLAYLLAFSTILISWIGHHILIGQVKAVSQNLLIVNAFFLLTVSFLPFPTSVVAEHLRSDSGSAAAAFYALSNLFNSLAFYLLGRTILAAQPDAAVVIGRSQKDSFLGIFWCLGCAALALLSPVISLLLVAALFVWWIRPMRPALQVD
ncbi:DUF1211 domain-containing protein [Deinococcus detaillensis]|uniref:DUF1211 domain-containing protein n=1 Tax=Deinococcus detaillensis TaxID=2592048 RepID=A0A553V1Q9_9DEIO|nr:TMEM175 family protein [Deinococcus detaillensis]TSA86380.1 DUF1211 domain-containing protein [Deinococcus detaillensis]